MFNCNVPKLDDSLSSVSNKNRENAAAIRGYVMCYEGLKYGSYLIMFQVR
jgi:hypothetical protein